MAAPVTTVGTQSEGGAGEGAPGRVAVQLPLPLGTAYDYAVPAGLTVGVGDFVQVPLGRRAVIGVVWGPGEGAVAPEKLKPVEHRFDAPPLPDLSRRFVEWVASYTLSHTGSVLRMAMSVPAALEPPAAVILYQAAGSPPEDARLTAARRRVLALLADGPPRAAREIAMEAGCGQGVVKQMAEQGLLETVAAVAEPRPPVPDGDRPGPELEPDQEAAAAALRRAVADGGFTVTLVDGVTGSGKTEVYFEAVAAALAAGRQVLVLLPEIALSAQWLDRFEARFGAPPVVWHSELTPAQRRRNWRAVAQGRARVVVGARSALFLPYPDLGLIVVDEEHDGAFKQEDGVIYHARDMAVVRAHLGGIPAVLVSATPSIETVVNVEAGRYQRLHLPERVGAAAMPTVTAIDLRRETPPRGRFLAPPLLDAVRQTLAAGEQAMLFLNRRGYAPLTLCRACGHRFECPNCSAWLVDHRLRHRLVCHHCGFEGRRPAACPVCAAEDSLVACGPGVERIAEEIDLDLPEARWSIVASDTISGPSAMAALAEAMASGATNLLIGTQVLAKGHHFPGLTLVGVVDADLGFNTGDFRAFERTFQLLHQVSGRAGRADRPGRVLLQTYEPDHPVLQALVADDRDGFVAGQIALRRRAGLPPFGRLAAVIVAGPDRAQADETARALARAAPQGEDITVIGPAEAPLAMLRGWHRRRLLVKTSRAAPLQRLLRDWLSRVKIPNAVRVAIDVDPQSFL
ncbi:MAG: primosomal protein N' [Azospirillaceae bacterium]